MADSYKHHGAHDQNLSFSKLDSENYEEWKIDVKYMLMDSGLWGIIDGTDKEPAEGAKPAEKELHLIRGQRALSRLALALDNAHKKIIIECKTASEAWKTLEDIYQPKSRGRIAALRTEFVSLRFTPPESMPSYLARLTSVARQLELAGRKLDDEEVAYQMITKLPPGYQHTVILAYHLDKADFNPRKVKELLTADYERQKRMAAEETGENTTSTALISDTRPKDKQNCSRPQIQPQDTRKRSVKCFRCNKLGHIARNCYAKNPQPNSNNPRKQRQTEPKPKEVALLSTVTPLRIREARVFDLESCAQIKESAFYASASAFVTLKKDPDGWVFDSAATHHFCNNKAWFYNYRSIETPITIAQGSIKAVGRGDIAITAQHQSEQVILYLRDVIHVPLYSRNLLSARIIDECGLKAIIKNGQIQVFDTNEELVIASHLDSETNLYILDAKVITDLKEIPLSKSRQNEKPRNPESQMSQNNDIELWHQRLGHPNIPRLKELNKKKLVRGLPELKGEMEVCIPCKVSKAAKVPSCVIPEIKSKRVLQLVHSDVWGPAPKSSFGGSKYFISFIDDYSRKARTYVMKAKNEAFQKYKEYKAWTERQTGEKLRRLRTDNGMEYVAEYFETSCIKDGIQVERSNTYSPEMNGVAERFNRTVMDGVRTLLEDSRLPQGLWAEALYTFAYLSNRLPHAKLPAKVPEELWTGFKPSVKHLKRYGCLAFTVIPKPQRNKFSNRAKLGIMVGYAIHTKGYRIWFPRDKRVIETKHVSFKESCLGIKKLWETKDEVYSYDYNSYWPETLTNDTETDEPPSPSPSDDEEEVKEEKEESTLQQKELQSHVEPVEPEKRIKVNRGEEIRDEDTTSKNRVQQEIPQLWRREEKVRTSGATKGRIDVCYYDSHNRAYDRIGKIEQYCHKHQLPFDPNQFSFKPTSGRHKTPKENMEAHCIEIPRNFDEAIKSPQIDKWNEAMNAELNTIEGRDVWKLVPKPENRRIIGNRWVYDIKRKATGEIARYKARLVAQGFSQEYGEDYCRTYAPVVTFALIRLFILIFVTSLGWFHRHLDIKGAYLYGSLDEEIYMRQPKGFVQSGKEDHVLRLHKALYGLKQSGRQWFTELENTLIDLGFTRLLGCNCIYRYNMDAIIIVYVDDLILLTRTMKLIRKITEMLQSIYDIVDLGELHYFLGVQFDFESDGQVKIHQTGYVHRIAKEMKISADDKVAIPLPAGTLLTKRDSSANGDLEQQYRKLVGILLYLAQHTRPDIAYVVSNLARFSSNPGAIHFKYIQNVLRYVCSTSEYGLHYSSVSDLRLEAFTDASWASDQDDRKSTSGYVVLLGDNPIDWRSKKQPTVALSTMESEYLALAEAGKELIWLNRILNEVIPMCNQINNTELTPLIKCDNQSAIYFSENRIENNRSKHIDIKYHYLRDCVTKNIFKIDFVRTEDNLADIFTKLLAKGKFIDFTVMLKLFRT